jgi:hypothetical protein
MSSAVIASGVVAVVVLGFGAQNRAMLSAGAAGSLRPVFDNMVASISGGLLQFTLAFGTLHFFEAWVGSTAMILASLLLAVSGLARYFDAPRGGYDMREADMMPAHPAEPDAALLPMEHFKSAESWAVAFFLAGATCSGAVSLAAAFAGLIMFSAAGLGIWALAGWSGCLHLASNWHRRHLDWGLGLMMFFAAVAAICAVG